MTKWTPDYLKVVGGDAQLQVRYEESSGCLAHLTQLHKLEHLVLNDLALRGRGFALLSATVNLAHLELSGTEVDAAGLAEIAQFRSLRYLDVSNCRYFDDDAMAQVLRMRGLRHLDLNGNALIGEGKLLQLGALEQLRHLELADIHGTSDIQTGAGAGLVVTARTGDGVGVDDRVLEVIGTKLQRLRFLNVAGCEHITDLGVRQLDASRHLHSLNLTRCPRISAAALMRLSRQPHWRLFGMPVTEPRVVQQLASTAVGLIELRLSGSSNTRPPLQDLPRLPALEVVQLEGMTLRAADLLPLEECPRLDYIRVTGCSLTAQHDFQALVGRATMIYSEDGTNLIQFNKHKRR